mgnify:CR=1 FL=1
MGPHGLCRIPYYPELNCINDSLGDQSALVLSVLLYWYSKDRHQRFNARCHVQQLSRNLKIDSSIVRECLDKLHKKGILDYEKNTFTTNSDNPDKKEKTDEFFDLNFHNLHEVLKSHGLNISIKVLRLASDDSFDHMAYIAPSRLPDVQGLKGLIKGDIYDKTALNIAFILCGICKDPQYEDFSYKALAPGWRMLVQADADPYAVSERWKRDGERSVDVDLGDGAFFLPDGNYFGTEKHYIWHNKKALEPKILAAALYLVATAFTKDVEFYSDLSLDVLEKSLSLLHRFTNLTGIISNYYFDTLDIQGKERDEALIKYNNMIEKISKEETLNYYN